MAKDYFSGLDDAIKKINKSLKSIESGTIDGLFDAGVMISDESTNNAPEVLKNLKRSAFVVGPDRKKSKAYFRGKIGPIKEYRSNHSRVIEKAKSDIATSGNKEVHIGHSVPYAIYVHENPRAGKTGGFSPSGRKYPEGSYSVVGAYKFLERAIMKNIRRAKTIIINRAKKA